MVRLGKAGWLSPGSGHLSPSGRPGPSTRAVEGETARGCGLRINRFWVRHAPVQGPELEQVHEQHQWAIPAEVAVDEEER